jgi:hypothetical protein
MIGVMSCCSPSDLVELGGGLRHRRDRGDVVDTLLFFVIVRFMRKRPLWVAVPRPPASACWT